MKKVRISLLVVCVFLLFTCTICAASSYEVNSVPRLKKEIKEAYRDGKMSEKEKKAITAETNPVVLTKFVEEKNETSG